MRIVIALGGNALLKRGEPMTAEKQLANIKIAATQIAKIAPGNQLIITHGNGPQVGLLALQGHAHPFPLDVLDAETEGMIGYLLEQEIANCLRSSRAVVTLLTRVVVNAHDPAFGDASKPIGPLYSKADAEHLTQTCGWQMLLENQKYRRIVASPEPQHIINIDAIAHLLKQDTIVIAAGGGGIPVIFDESSGHYRGAECVIDKDLSSALLAIELAADHLLIATDIDAVYHDWKTVNQKAIRDITEQALQQLEFAKGSMAPKVRAVCNYVQATQKSASIGALENIYELLQGSSGTRIHA